MMQQTSIQSYVQLQIENALCPLQKKVYDFLILNPNSSDREISLALGLAINCVTGRRNELVELGVVGDCGIKYDFSTNRKVHGWKVIVI